MNFKTKILSLKNKIKDSYNEVYRQEKKEQLIELTKEQAEKITDHVNSAVKIYKDQLQVSNINAAMLLCCCVTDAFNNLNALDLTSSIFKRQVLKCFEIYPNKAEFIEKVCEFTDGINAELTGLIGEQNGKSSFSQDTEDAE